MARPQIEEKKMSKRWYHNYAIKNGYQINDEIEEMIHQGLERKKQILGARYCPCKLKIPAKTYARA